MNTLQKVRNTDIIGAMEAVEAELRALLPNGAKCSVEFATRYLPEWPHRVRVYVAEEDDTPTWAEDATWPFPTLEEALVWIRQQAKEVV